MSHFQDKAAAETPEQPQETLQPAQGTAGQSQAIKAEAEAPQHVEHEANTPTVEQPTEQSGEQPTDSMRSFLQDASNRPLEQYHNNHLENANRNHAQWYERICSELSQAQSSQHAQPTANTPAEAATVAAAAIVKHESTAPCETPAPAPVEQPAPGAQPLPEQQQNAQDAIPIQDPSGQCSGYQERCYYNCYRNLLWLPCQLYTYSIHILAYPWTYGKVEFIYFFPCRSHTKNYAGFRWWCWWHQAWCREGPGVCFTRFFAVRKLHLQQNETNCMDDMVYGENLQDIPFPPRWT